MQLGLALPHYDFSFPDGGPATVARAASYARRAEALGFDSVWVSDHLFLDLGKYGGPATRFRALEPFTTLAAAAAETRRVRLGTLVLCAGFRPAPLVALMAGGLEELSGGRLDLGIGAGWYEDEYRAAGLPFGTPGQRIAHMEQVLDVVRVALEEGRVPDPEDVTPWQGDAKARPPLWIGGKGGPRIMRAVARHADGWNVVWRITPDEYRARLRTLADACADAGRDPATVRRSIGLACLLGHDRRDIERRYETLRAWAPGGALDGVDLNAFAAGALVGTPEECAERLREFEALGVETTILTFANVPFALADDEQLEIAANELRPLIA